MWYLLVDRSLWAYFLFWYHEVKQSSWGKYKMGRQQIQYSILYSWRCAESDKAQQESLVFIIPDIASTLSSSN